jgi:phospholipid transport system transporter-binding protein
MALTLPAAVTLDEVPVVLRALEAELADRGTGPLTLDASSVRELDTSAVALLLHAERLAARHGRALELQGVPDKLLSLASLYGVESLLPSSASPAEARATAGTRSV